MADLSQDEVVEYLSNLSVMELTDLVDELEEEWGVEAGAAAAAPVAAAAGGEAEGEEGGEEEEQTIFDVSLEDFGDNKIQVIKAVRQVTDLGLKDAKEKVENLPSVIKDSIDKETADDVKEELEDAGATVELK
ncbi:MAG: 50S ribosomal protein L7/L12 [Bradymonadaceae bacterium]